VNKRVRDTEKDVGLVGTADYRPGCRKGLHRQRRGRRTRSDFAEWPRMQTDQWNI